MSRQHCIGYLNPNSDAPDCEFYGRIITLQLDLALRLEPTTRRSDSAPTHTVYSRSLSGQAVAIGAAWLRHQKRHDSGAPFLSLSIDDPSLPHTLNVAAFKDDSGKWPILWRRRVDPASSDK